MDLPSAEVQLKNASHNYLIKGGRWTGWASVFILLLMLINIGLQTTTILTVSNITVYMLPIFITIAVAALVAKIFSTSRINEVALLIYLALLEFGWLFLIWAIFVHSDDEFVGVAALAGVESIIDVLVLTFAIALFTSRKLMLMAILPFMLLNFVLRLIEVPENYIFPLTKFTCFLAIIISGQKVLYSWFSTAIIRDIEKQHLLKSFKRMALIDGLTSLSNRRHFDELLSQEIRAAERNNHPLSVLLIDVDFFKKLNDSLGHQVGDDCLVALGKVLTAIANRPRDLAARYGGEEFAILLPDTDLEGALKIAAKLKVKLASAKLPHPNSEVSEFITVSQGVSQWQPKMSIEELMKNADTGLYDAKGEGRNRFSAA